MLAFREYECKCGAEAEFRCHEDAEQRCPYCNEIMEKVFTCPAINTGPPCSERAETGADGKELKPTAGHKKFMEWVEENNRLKARMKKPKIIIDGFKGKKD